jgi:glycosyltransferase involved in cell wall biosynthesis
MSSLHACPRVTLILPVYNGEAYLRPAIDSLLRQTFRDFELLIIDDGSTDGSAAIVASYGDERIRFQRNARNLGLIATLNKGFELARGEFIARMDCDDISLPHRLERQLDYLACHPDVALVGSWFEKLQGRHSRVVKTPVDHAAIRFFLIFDNTFLHSSIMIRRSLLEQFNLRFDPAFPYAEDYELWVRISRYARVANIPEVLVQYRDHADNTSNRFRQAQNDTADRIRRVHLASLGLVPDDPTLRLHLAITNFRWQGQDADLIAARDWLEALRDVGRAVLGLPDALLLQSLDRYWYGVCGTRAQDGFRVWLLFQASALGRQAGFHWRCRLFLRCLLRRPIRQQGTS